jgi:chemotaxis protein methyltransferase CheR
MKDEDCIAFLQWSLPRMRLEWTGFRKVRKLVCKRIERRRAALGLDDIEAYRRRLGESPAEWQELRALCSIPISRFYRDRAAFEALGSTVLPALASAAAEQGRTELDCWSAGCASGEEPYTLSIVWQVMFAAHHPHMEFHVLATDIDDALLGRAQAACYRESELKELPDAWRTAAFEAREGEYCLREPFRKAVTFVHQDLCAQMPQGRFDLLLCRNVAFTYFERSVQQKILEQFADRLHPGGALMIGISEDLPRGTTDFVSWTGVRGAFRSIRGR